MRKIHLAILEVVQKTIEVVKTEPSSSETITIGKTRPFVFWPVLLASFLVLAGFVSLIPSGAIAVAANIPSQFIIKADKFTLTDAKLVIGKSKAFNIPAAITTGDGVAHNLSISKVVHLPYIGGVRLTIRAGKNSPAILKGSRTDITKVTASRAEFDNEVATIEGDNGLRILVDEQTLYNATIRAPYLSVDFATFPDITIEVERT